LRRAECRRASGPDIDLFSHSWDGAAVKQAAPSVVNATLSARPSTPAVLCANGNRDRATFAGTVRFEPIWREAPMPLLQDKVCVITGGAGSLGLASARLFLGEGATLMLSI
jgi:hypothetical protein